MLHLYRFVCVVAVKVQVLEADGGRYSKELVRALNNLQDKTSHRPLYFDRKISHLKSNGIEILNSLHQYGHDEVWIWCKSQKGLAFLQDLYESHMLAPMLEDLLAMLSYEFKAIKLYIDTDQFKKEIGKFLNMFHTAHAKFSNKCLIFVALVCVSCG